MTTTVRNLLDLKTLIETTRRPESGAVFNARLKDALGQTEHRRTAAGDDGPDLGEHGVATDESGEFWGDQGAGVLIQAKDSGRILFAYRSEFVNEPHTWGVWGGAIDGKESPLAAVRREIREETGYSGQISFKPLYVFTKGSFKFTTFLGEVPTEFVPKLDWETEDYRWVTPGDWPDPLHFGVKELLPQLESATGAKQAAGIYDGYCPVCGKAGCGGSCTKTGALIVARPSDATLLKKTPGATPEMLAEAAKVDNDRYLGWVLKHVVSGDIHLPQDAALMRQALHVFHISQGSQGGGHKNIDRLTPKALLELAKAQVDENMSARVVELMEESSTFDDVYAKMQAEFGPERLRDFLQGVGGISQVRRRWDMMVGDAHDHAGSLEHHRVSARKPWAAGADPNSVHAKTKLQPSVAAYSNPEALDKAVAVFESYPGFQNLQGDTPTKLKQIIKRLADNLVWLYNQVDPDVRDRSKMWYVGGNRLVHRWAKHYGIEPYKVAGVIAVLSPQRDWFQNVSLAERTLDVITQQMDTPWTPEMSQAVVDWVQRAEEDRAKTEARKRKNMGEEAYAQLQEGRRQRAEQKRLKELEKRQTEEAPDTGEGDEEEEDASAMLKMVPLCEGKTLREVLDNKALAALWIRAHDQTYNHRNYRVVSPEGEFGDWARKVDYSQQAATWSSLPNIWKALDIFQCTSPRQVSDLVGDNHKVRSFYNNLIAPHSKGGDVTIDTHAVAAALLRPLAASHREVHHNFGTTKKGGGVSPRAEAASGNIGTYPIYADAYRVAAKRLGVLPREVQSVTWEAVRTLFKPTQKNDDALQNGIIDTWEGVSRGKSPERARNAIRDLAGGFDAPAWAGPHYQPHDYARHSSYKGELRPHD